VVDSPICAMKDSCSAGTSTLKCPISCDMMPEGTLLDFSKCTGKPVQTKKLEGKVTLKSSKCVTEPLAKGAIAAGLGFDTDAKKSFIDAEVKCDERRLSSDGNERRLNSHATKESEISYTVYVPEGVDHTTLVDKVEDFNKGGSDAQAAFVKHLEDEGEMTVDADSIVAEPPTVSNVVITVNADGSLAQKPVPIDQIPKKPSPVPAPASEEEGGNVGAIVGGIIGGLVALALIGGIAYYFLVVKKRSES